MPDLGFHLAQFVFRFKGIKRLGGIVALINRPK